MTNQITIPRETWDAVLEALERIADKRNTHFAGDAQVLASSTLTAANAVSVGEPTGHDGKGCNEVLRLAGRAYPRTCKACGLGPCKWKSAANAVQPQAQGELVDKLFAVFQGWSGSTFGWQDSSDLNSAGNNFERAKKAHEDECKRRLLAVLSAHPQATEPAGCIWTQQDDEHMPDTWASSCGELWSFIDGGPKDNRVSYCHHCGGKVKLAAPDAP